MQQIWIPRIGDPDVMEVRDAPDPTPDDGEVRILVKASGVNFADLMARMGLYPDAPPLAAVVGYEVAGVIDAVGKGVDEKRVGERVLSLTKFGGYSSMICVAEAQAVPFPDELDDVHAASIPVTGLTSWMMLEVMGRVREGDRVLVHSAGGGVGLMALDLLKHRGAFAIGTASKKKHAFLEERGYDQLIDYTQEDFHEVLKEAEGLDLILDPVGGESWSKGMDLMRAGGRLVVFGMSANASSTSRKVTKVLKNMTQVPWLKMNPIYLMNHNIGVMGVNMGHLWHESERVTGWLRELLLLVDKGEVRPLVHVVFPFSEAGAAHQWIHDRKNIGKVILVPDDVFDGERLQGEA